jgi:hypothetical protein
VSRHRRKEKGKKMKKRNDEMISPKVKIITAALSEILISDLDSPSETASCPIFLKKTHIYSFVENQLLYKMN